MKTGGGFLGRLRCLLLAIGCALTHTSLMAQSVSFTAGPTAEIIEPSIPPVFGGPSNANVSLVSNPIAVDFRRNGRADVVVGVGLLPIVPPMKVPMRVLRSGTNGVMSDITRQLFGSGALPSSAGQRVYAADFNNDGRPDLFCAGSGYDASPFSGETNILLQQAADGSFLDRSSFLPTALDFTHSAGIGDINGDGITDIYVGNVWGSGQVGPYFLIGKPDGTYIQKDSNIPASIVSLNQKFTTSLLLDIDNDGYPDLVLGTHGANGFHDNIVLFNDGTGDFTKRQPYTLPVGPLGNNITALDIQTIDVNNDGYPDLLIVSTQQVPSYVGGSIQLLVNQRDGTFVDETVARLGSTATMTSGIGWVAVQVVDINGDGKPDILASTEYGWFGAVSYSYLWINNGNGVFSPISATTLSPSPIGKLVAADINGDGQLDLVSVQFAGTGNLMYQTYLNTSSRTAPSEPIVGTASAGNGQATVSFASPLFTGASPITGYAVTCKGGYGVSPANASGLGSPITVPGLVNGVSYFCWVTATNANATSLPSGESNRVIPQGTLIVAITGNGTSLLGASATFTATLANGTAPSGTITFKAFGNTINGCVNKPVAANIATCTTTGLTYGPQMITAHYSGDGINPPTASPAVLQTVNAGVLASASSTALPTVAVGSTYSFFQAIQNVGSASLDLTSFSYTGPFSQYVNSCGATLAAGASCMITINYEPTTTLVPSPGTMQVTHSGANNPFTINYLGAATSLNAPILTSTFNPASVIVGNASATLTFTLTNPNNVPLTNAYAGFNLPGFMLTASVPNPTTTCGGQWAGASWLGGGTAASRTAVEFTGGTIPPSSSCTISIAIVSTAGVGSYAVTQIAFNSAELAGMYPAVTLIVTPPPTVPDPPIGVSAAPGDAQATITFSLPANNGGSPITAYHVTCNGGAISVLAVRSPVSLTGLSNGTPYSCQVTASNSIGTSAPSAVVNVTPASNALLFLVAVQSRKTHSTAGTFDLRIDPMKLANGAVSVEPRIGSTGHTVVFQFNVLLASAGNVSATDSISGPVSNVTVTRSGRDVIVTVSGIPDNRRVTITLTGVAGPSDSTDVSATIGFLVGDVNGSHAVNAGDVSAVKAHVGQLTTLTNFWLDLNGSGGISPADVSAVKARSGLTLP